MTRILIVTAVEAERAAVLRGLGRDPAETDPTVPGPTTPGLAEPSPAEPSPAELGAPELSPPELSPAQLGAPELSPAELSPADGDRPKTSTREGDRIDVLAGGVGSAAAAASTAVALALAGAHGRPYHIVVSMGIGGAFIGRAAIGDLVVGTASIAADLGAQSPDGFLSVTDLGFGQTVIDADAELVAALVKAGAAGASVLTVSTVTGSAERASELAGAYPDAAVEAMEGYGVACAAAATGTRFVEVRTISNLVGPRDRAAWRIGDALTALSAAAESVSTLEG